MSDIRKRGTIDLATLKTMKLTDTWTGDWAITLRSHDGKFTEVSIVSSDPKVKAQKPLYFPFRVHALRCLLRQAIEEDGNR